MIPTLTMRFSMRRTGTTFADVLCRDEEHISARG